MAARAISASRGAPCGTPPQIMWIPIGGRPPSAVPTRRSAGRFDRPKQPNRLAHKFAGAEDVMVRRVLLRTQHRGMRCFLCRLSTIAGNVKSVRLVRSWWMGLRSQQRGPLLDCKSQQNCRIKRMVGSSLTEAAVVAAQQVGSQTPCQRVVTARVVRSSEDGTCQMRQACE